MAPLLHRSLKLDGMESWSHSDGRRICVAVEVLESSHLILFSEELLSWPHLWLSLWSHPVGSSHNLHGL